MWETFPPAWAHELEKPVSEDEDTPEHLLLVQLHVLVVIRMSAHVDYPIHVQVQVVYRRGVLLQPTDMIQDTTTEKKTEHTIDGSGKKLIGDVRPRPVHIYLRKPTNHSPVYFT